MFASCTPFSNAMQDLVERRTCKRPVIWYLESYYRIRKDSSCMRVFRANAALEERSVICAFILCSCHIRPSVGRYEPSLWMTSPILKVIPFLLIVSTLNYSLHDIGYRIHSPLSSGTQHAHQRLYSRISDRDCETLQVHLPDPSHC